MREAMLIVHLLGLVMGLGNSFAFMFLGIAGSKMEKEEGKKFALNTFAISTMGHIGITMLIISGLYLMTRTGTWRWPTRRHIKRMRPGRFFAHS